MTLSKLWNWSSDCRGRGTHKRLARLGDREIQLRRALWIGVHGAGHSTSLSRTLSSAPSTSSITFLTPSNTNLHLRRRGHCYPWFWLSHRLSVWLLPSFLGNSASFFIRFQESLLGSHFFVLVDGFGLNYGSHFLVVSFYQRKSLVFKSLLHNSFAPSDDMETKQLQMPSLKRRSVLIGTLMGENRDFIYLFLIN